MKVCWFGIYDAGYSRNKVLVSGLRAADVEVIECNAFEHKGFKKYIRLIKQLINLQNDYDVLFCAFPINYNVIIAKLFQKKPIVIDAFFPLYDAYVVDRKTISKFSFMGLLFYLLDKINLRLADLSITDTEQHKKYWKKVFSKANVEVLPVGASADEFYPIPYSPINDSEFIVSFHGSYIPLQGVDNIIEAAILLKKHIKIKFRFIGPKKMHYSLEKVAQENNLNIELVSWLSTAELNKKLNEADVILGIFGDTPKTDRVVPNKVFQGIAVRKPVVTKDTLAVRELFSPADVMLVKNTPEAIAAAILLLAEDSSERYRLATSAYRQFVLRFNEITLGGELKRRLSMCICQK